MKQGSATANTLGTLAVMYSGFGVLLSWARGEDDEINTIIAGTATGLLYKSSGKFLFLKLFLENRFHFYFFVAGLRKCAMGGGVGLALSGMYCIWVAAGSGKRMNQYM